MSTDACSNHPRTPRDFNIAATCHCIEIRQTRITKNYPWHLSQRTDVKNPAFEEDDYAEIHRRYFAELWTRGHVDADPSGWLSTYSEAEGLLQLPQMSASSLSKYYVDEGCGLAAYKERLLALLSEWEGHHISVDEFTLCPSGACASLVVLATLKTLGVNRILFETPAYFATIEQAGEIGLRFDLSATYREDGYALRAIGKTLRSDSHVALWITQPRAALGFDQPHAEIISLLEKLGRKRWLVTDEVTDQSFPAHMGKIVARYQQANLIRIRNFTKGMGLNGLRLAAILHPPRMRKHIVDAVETLGGSIDAHSLAAVVTLGEDIPRFRRMLAAANEQVNTLRARAERLVAGTPIAVNRLTNGYIGSMIADLRELGRKHGDRRTRLLEWCCSKRTPIILGSSFYMAKAPPTEAIRLNFFNRPENVTRGIINILGLWNAV